MPLPSRNTASSVTSRLTTEPLTQRCRRGVVQNNGGGNQQRGNRPNMLVLRLLMRHRREIERRHSDRSKPAEEQGFVPAPNCSNERLHEQHGRNAPHGQDRPLAPRQSGAEQREDWHDQHLLVKLQVRPVLMVELISGVIARPHPCECHAGSQHRKGSVTPHGLYNRARVQERSPPAGQWLSRCCHDPCSASTRARLHNRQPRRSPRQRPPSKGAPRSPIATTPRRLAR